MIFINFKTYQQGTGHQALELAHIMEEVASQAQTKLIPVVQAVDLKQIVQETKLEVWAQKVDAVDFGSHTGSILPEALVEAGAAGSFLNHSENKITSFELLATTHQQARDQGLKTLIFASDLSEFNAVLKLKPDYISYEPSELIGSKDKSVATEKPDIISQVSVLSKEVGIPLIVGAGIHSQNDIRVSLKLGATGFAVASDILKAKDPKKELLDLTQGYN